MYKQIMVPLDGSKLAESAIPFAVRIATECKGQITLFAVSPPGGFPQGKRLSSYLNDRCRELIQPHRLPACTIVHFGDTADRILDYAKHAGMDLIVIPSHGETGPGRCSTGNICTKVINETHTPLLLVKIGPGLNPHNVMARWKILVPLDGSEMAEKILPCVYDLAIDSDNEIILFGVSKPCESGKYGFANMAQNQSNTCQQVMERTEQSVEQYLQKLQNQIKSQDMHVKIDISCGKAADEIIRYAESKDINIIAMTTQGESGYSRSPFGSVADKVIHGTSKPVLMLRPHPRIIH